MSEKQTVPLTPTKIKLISQSLEYGDRTKIADALQVSRQTVNNALAGNGLNDTTRSILQFALQLIEERKKSEVKLAKKLAK